MHVRHKGVPVPADWVRGHGRYRMGSTHFSYQDEDRVSIYSVILLLVKTNYMSILKVKSPALFHVIIVAKICGTLPQRLAGRA